MRKAFQFEYLCCIPVGGATQKKNQPEFLQTLQDQTFQTLGLTFWRYKRFPTGSAPADGVNLRDAEVTPEVFTVVVVKALIPQESLEPCGEWGRCALEQ